MSKLFAGAALAAAMFTGAADAAVLITAQDVGTDLVFTYSGTLDLSGMPQDGQDFSPRQLIAQSAGAILSYNADVDRYIGGPLPSFGSGSLSNGVTVGTDFAIFSNAYIGLQAGYQSGDAIFGTLTFSNASIASANLFDNTSVTATLSSGDTITMRIGNVNVVPLPAGLPLLAGGFLAFGALKRRKRG